MSRACRIAPVVSMVAFVLLPAMTQAAAEIRVERLDEAFHIEATATLAANAATAWQVLTDYNGLANFVPDLRVSRVVSAAGEPLRLEQSGDAGFLVLTFRIDVVLELDEAPPGRLAFRAVAGNVKRMRGHWLIRNAPAGIVLNYEAELEPAFRVPGLIATALIRRNVARQFGGVVSEILKREAVRNAAAPRGNKTGYADDD